MERHEVTGVRYFSRRAGERYKNVYVLALAAPQRVENTLRAFSEHPDVTLVRPNFRGFPDPQFDESRLRIRGEIIARFREGTMRATGPGRPQSIIGIERLLPDRSLEALMENSGVLAVTRAFGQFELRDSTGWVSLLSAAERGRVVAQRNDARALRAMPGESVPDLENWLRFELPYDADVEHLMVLLRGHPAILHVQPNYLAESDAVPNDEYWDAYNEIWDMNYLWGLERIGVVQAWNVLAVPDQAPDTGDVTVAVVDLDGVNYHHPDLVTNIWRNPGETIGNGVDDDGNGHIDDVVGWDFFDNDDDPYVSGQNHGTHVAGTIAAVGNNGIGVVGVTWNAKILAVRFDGTSGQASEAIVYATDSGADIICISWHIYGIDRVIDDAVHYAHALGMVVVASAGNFDVDARVQAPAQSAAAITTSNFNFLDRKNGTSNFGVKIDVAAPGSVIFSTSGEYGGLSGTSQAAPHVAGLAALVLGYDPTLTNEGVRQVIRRWADDISDPLGDGADWSGHDIFSGYGRIHAGRALQELARGRKPAVAWISNLSANFYHGVLPYHDQQGRYVAGLRARTQVSGSIEIRGYASGPNFREYTLSYGPGTHPTTWHMIVRGSDMAFGWPLGTLNTDDLPAGTYTLRLQVFSPFAPEVYEDRVEINVDRALILEPAPGRLVYEPVPVKGFAVGANFVSYHLEYGVGADPEDWYRLTSDMSQPVDDGTLVALLPLEALPDGLISLKLVVQETEGLSEHVVQIVIDTTHFPYQSGWPVERGPSSSYDGIFARHSVPAIGDLDADGNKEVVVGFGNLLYVHESDGRVRDGWPAPIAGMASVSPPALGDVDGDGYLEIGMKSQEVDRELVYLFDLDGSLRPGWPLARPSHFESLGAKYERNSSVVFEDVDGDGLLDVVFGTFGSSPGTGGEVHARRADGSDIEGWPRSLDAPVTTTPAVGDLDEDGHAEIVALTADGSVWILDREGNSLWEWPIDTDGDVYHQSPVLLDLDDDGDLEIAVAASRSSTVPSESDRGKIFLWHHHGWLYDWPPLFDLYLYQPGVGDLDGDGTPEIVAAGAARRFTDFHADRDDVVFEAVALRADGGIATGWDPFVFQLPIFPGFPMVGDVDDDDLPEVIISNWLASGPNIFAINADGTLVSDPRWPIRKRSSAHAPIALDDLDQDGDIEVVFAGYSGKNQVEVWDLPASYKPSLTHWSTVHGNPRRTGVFRPDASAVLLLDTSGSMTLSPDGALNAPEDQKRLYLSRQAASAFVDLLNHHAVARANLGMTVFPTHPASIDSCGAGVALTLRRVTQSSVEVAKVETLGGLVGEGNTPMLEGLERAANLFGSEAYRAIVLLSDGYHNCPSLVSVDDPVVTRIIERLKSRSIRVYTIGFGRPTDPDHPLLSTIAEDTGGLFFDVTQTWPLPPGYDVGLALHSTYTTILADALELDLDRDPDSEFGTVRAGERVVRDVAIGEGDRRVSVLLRWSTAEQRRLGLVVKAADGRPIPTDAPGVVIREESHYTLITIAHPLLSRVGKTGLPWQIEIDASALPSGQSEPFQFSVLIDSRLRLVARLDARAYETGEAITVTARLTEKGVPLVDGVDVFADVTGPQEGIGTWLARHSVSTAELAQIPMRIRGELLPPATRKAIYLTDVRGVAFPARTRKQVLKLHDDGTHGDVAAGDGIYTNRYTETTRPGTHVFRIRARGHTSVGKLFRRERSLHKYVDLRVSADSIALQVDPIAVSPWNPPRYQLTVNPKGDFGNHLGPGRAADIKVEIPEGELLGPLRDALNGTYHQAFELPQDASLCDVAVVVVLKGAKAVWSPGFDERESLGCLSDSVTAAPWRFRATALNGGRDRNATRAPA
jgi:hypothetical protein